MSLRVVNRRSLFGAVGVLLLILAVPGWAQETTVFSQTTDFNGGLGSQNDTSNGGLGNFATTYENFTLSSAASINEVSWDGSLAGAGGITGFTIDFYSNSGNAPGALLASFVIGGNAGQTFLQNDNAGNATYQYLSLLGSSFTAAAGQEYWISIVPTLTYPPQWFWETSSDGDSNSYQCFFGTCGNDPYDLSLQLDAPTATPEPSSLILMGSGIMGIAGSLRRKLWA